MIPLSINSLYAQLAVIEIAEVDPSDKSIKSYLVRHHRFDPDTHHFRWFVVKAFDNEQEMNKLLELLWADLESRRLKGESHLKEQIVGQINDPERDTRGWIGYEPIN